MRAILFLIVALLICSPKAMSQTVHQSISGYTPQRVYDAGRNRFTDFETMVLELSRADVAFIGEQHDDPATHRLERAILEGLSRRRGNIVVAMEMFERDVQQPLNDYLAGQMSEEEFLKVSRPWPKYATDYRPIVEFAKAHQWPVIAGNVPRRLASQVSRQGLKSIDELSETDRKFVAAQIECPPDDYYNRFVETMTGHPGAHGGAEKELDEKKKEEQKAMIERFYQAQCVKDETMAEAIIDQLKKRGEGDPKPVVVHFNGAFHSDYRLGAAARTVRRLPNSQVKVVTIIPVDNLDYVKPEEYAKRADYVVFAVKPVGK